MDLSLKELDSSISKIEKDKLATNDLMNREGGMKFETSTNDKSVVRNNQNSSNYVNLSERMIFEQLDSE